MTNPFDTIMAEMQEIKGLVAQLMDSPTVKNGAAPPLSTEIIDTKQLCTRLKITEPTAVRWRRKGKIPYLTIGSVIRYNWPSVITALENIDR